MSWRLGLLIVAIILWVISIVLLVQANPSHWGLALIPAGLCFLAAALIPWRPGA